MTPALALIRPASDGTARPARGRSARGETARPVADAVVVDTGSVAQPDESTLITAAQKGEREAFGVLVRIHQRRAYAIARAIVATHEDAEDAVQEGFLHAYRALARFVPGQPFGAWLHRIVANAALDLTRRRRVRDADALPESYSVGSFDPAEASDLRSRLEEALATLSDRQRAVIVMHDVQGFRHGEIGRLLGIPEGTARSDLFHARLTLRRGLRCLREVR